MTAETYQKKVLELTARADAALDTLAEESKKSLHLQDAFAEQQGRIKESFGSAIEQLTTNFISGCSEVVEGE